MIDAEENVAGPGTVAGGTEEEEKVREDEDEQDEDKEEEMEAEEDMHVFSSPPVRVLKAIEPDEEALGMLFCRLPFPLCEREEDPFPPPPPPVPLRAFTCS
eukprot:evm.model.NODE_10431_length_8836_cov_15.761657.2